MQFHVRELFVLRCTNVQVANAIPRAPLDAIFELRMFVLLMAHFQLETFKLSNVNLNIENLPLKTRGSYRLNSRRNPFACQTCAVIMGFYESISVRIYFND